MAYSEHVWREHTGSAADKAGWLNNLETQWTNGCSYLDAITHSERYYSKGQCDAKYFTSANDGSGSGLVCETLDGYTAAQLLATSAPPGIIVYYQSLTPPAGWTLRNDLAGRFIVGAGDSYNPGNVGGSSSVTITASVTIGAHALSINEMPAHDHGNVTDYYGSSGGYGVAYFAGAYAIADSPVYSQNVNTSNVGSGSSHTHISSFSGSANQEKRPSFYTLAAIIKS